MNSCLIMILLLIKFFHDILLSSICRYCHVDWIEHGEGTDGDLYTCNFYVVSVLYLILKSFMVCVLTNIVCY